MRARHIKRGEEMAGTVRSSRKNGTRKQTLDVAFEAQTWEKIEPIITRYCSQNQVSRQAAFATLILKGLVAPDKKQEQDGEETGEERGNKRLKLSEADLNAIGEKFVDLDKAIGGRLDSLMRSFFDAEDLKAENDRLKAENERLKGH